MSKFIIRLLITGATILAVSTYLPALIKVRDFQSALLAALILALVNTLVRPVIVIITIPLTILTLGLFTLVINALMLYLVSFLLGNSFTIMGWWQAIIAAFLISVVSTFLSQRLFD